MKWKNRKRWANKQSLAGWLARVDMVVFYVNDCNFGFVCALNLLFCSLVFFFLLLWCTVIHMAKQTNNNNDDDGDDDDEQRLRMCDCQYACKDWATCMLLSAHWNENWTITIAPSIWCCSFSFSFSHALALRFIIVAHNEWYTHFSVSSHIKFHWNPLYSLNISVNCTQTPPKYGRLILPLPQHIKPSQPSQF